MLTLCASTNSVFRALQALQGSAKFTAYRSWIDVHNFITSCQEHFRSFEFHLYWACALRWQCCLISTLEEKKILPFPTCFPTCFHLQCRRSRFNPQVGKIPWRREWLPTPVFLPRKSHGRRNLEGYSVWGHQRVGHNLMTKQQQTEAFMGKMILWVGSALK